MKLLILNLTFFFSLLAQATALPPVNGIFKHRVFVDFETVVYNINIDLQKNTVHTNSTIIFNQNEDGHVIFDLKKPCFKIKLDNRKVKALPLLIPGPVSLAKSISRKSKAGRHTLEIESRLKRGVNFKNGVELGFWMRDLFGRKFLEQYLPTNFEFDQYKAKLNINFVNGTAKEHTLLANGNITIRPDGYTVDFPSFYNASSFFIHLFKTNSYNMDKSIFTRLDGKKIDFIVYSKDMSLTEKLKKKATDSLQNFEELYGTWPHDYLIIFGDQDSGGMEHAGATQTSLGSLDHELHHSYFSKGVMPENGNAGWMDEAIVTWKDRGFPKVETPSFKKHNLACHSVHRRSTDWDSYKKGGNFIGHLAFLFSKKGIEFKDVLRNYFQEYKYQIVNTKTFRLFLEKSYGESLLNKFEKYTCGNKTNSRI